MATQLLFRWNADDLEVKTKSVEKTLEPLITHVTTLTNEGPSGRKKGQSKKAEVLISLVQGATENFILQGEVIARENPEVQMDMMKAVLNVRKSGDHLRLMSIDFSQNPCSSECRTRMVKSARVLLTDVTRLLILADMVDVYLLLKSLQEMRGNLERIKSAQDPHSLTSSLGEFDRHLNEVNRRAGNRQIDLKDERRRDDMAAARATLKKNSAMLFTSSKAYVRHPELSAARANRDYVLGQVTDAVNNISEVAKATGPSLDQGFDNSGSLARALDEFENQIIMDPSSYSGERTRPRLEDLLEQIIGSAASLADFPSTRDERRDRIVRECQNLRSALQNLLDEYLYLSQNPGSTEHLDLARDQVYSRTRALRKQLSRAVTDHVSDSFLDTDMPLLLMFEAAGEGDELKTEAYAGVFVEHAAKLAEVANMVCSMSTNDEATRMVKMASHQLEELCPQVVYAARILAARPNSKVAQENAEVFKDAWLKQLQLLTDAVDDVVSLDDFLAVSEGHILEDINHCVLAIQERNPQSLDETAGRIRGRCARVCDVVQGEMMSYGGGSAYVDRVMECIRVLRDQIIVKFTSQMNEMIECLNSDTPFDENGFVRVSNLVYDGVRNIRKAVLNNQNIGDYDSDAEDDAEFERFSRNAQIRRSRRQDNVLYEEDSEGRAWMRNLPQEEKNKIQQQVQLFRMEKAKLDREMEKWDESGNDVILLAKQMCMVMMEMTDFMRGQGRLKSTMDIINAAKQISELGEQLDKLCKQIADQCQDSVTKKDLIAYLQRIALHCHQLNITSKVKADVQNIGGELIVSGLESATSLIQAAKNLMNAVVLSVRASYVASTKYPKAGATMNVTWKMKAPAKKPLVQMETLEDQRSRIKKGENKKTIEPIKALSEFHA